MADEILNWAHRFDEISNERCLFEHEADADQRTALAKALDLVRCDSFVARYDLRTNLAGRAELKGQFSAQGAQACVVSLEPVLFDLSQDVVVTFVPEGSVDEEPDIEHEALSLEDIEEYKGEAVHVGRVFFDHFGAALDPYPRAPGAALEVRAGLVGEDEDETTHPFAELGKLKRSS